LHTIFRSFCIPTLRRYDFSGVVEDVHPDDQEFKAAALRPCDSASHWHLLTPAQVGDEVFGCQWGDGDHGAPLKNSAGHVIAPVGSCFAEYVLVRKSCASKKPAALSHKVAAAGATLASLTAYQGMILF